ncbi:MAG: hypothetical protein LBP40_00395 [Campylobacteraceae bacterium]|jgi:prefoldin subunit 5|nr:hypothetical protein [Campylobacteraceae bacterium]
MTEIEQKEIKEIHKMISELSEALDLAQARIRLLECEVEALQKFKSVDKSDYVKGLIV